MPTATHGVERLKLDGLDLNVPDVAQVTNLVTNPSFEVDTAGWLGTDAHLLAGATLSRVTTQQYVDDAALQIVTTSGSDSQGAAFVFTGTFTSGVAYTASAYVKANVDTPLFAIFGNAAVDVATASPTALAAGWSRVTVTWTPSANRTDARFVLRTLTAVARTIYVDGAMAHTGSSAPAYFDGTYPGYEWSGTAHASTSRPAPRIVCEALSFNPSKKLLEWVKGADSNGAKLLRPPLHDNAEMDLTLRVEPQADMDAALDVVGEVGRKLQEAELVAAGGRDRGLELVWTPAGSTYSQTWYVQAGEFEEIPKDMAESGWPFRAPQAKVKLYLYPFGYGDEVTETAAASSDPLLTLTVADVPGDVPAEGTVTVTDTATQSRTYVLAGLEQWDYDAATSLIVDSDSLVTTGMAGVGATRAGAYDPGGAGNSVIRATLAANPVAVCATGELAHVGTFRVVARLYATSLDVSVRLAWRMGRDQWTTNPYRSVPAEDKFVEVDLGEITIREALLGTQTWQGRIEAKSSTAATTLDVDYLILVPTVWMAEIAQPPVFETPPVLSALDQFNQTAGALTGKTADIGGVWAGAGDADDFTVDAGDDWLERDAVSDGSAIFARAAISGASAMTAQAIQVDFFHDEYRGTAIASGVVARWVDIDNHLEASFGQLNDLLLVVAVVAGVGTTLAFNIDAAKIVKNTWYTMRLTVDGDGRWVVWLGPRGEAATVRGAGQHADLATGGALASGKPGIYDANNSADSVMRRYDNFQAWVPTTDAAIFSGQSLQFRSHGPDVAVREDSTGTYWGRPTRTRGGRFWLPPAGDGGRVSRIAVMARRNDIASFPSENLADGLSVQVKYRPRFVNPPTQAA